MTRDEHSQDRNHCQSIEAAFGERPEIQEEDGYFHEHDYEKINQIRHKVGLKCLVNELRLNLKRMYLTCS